jgi:hypothetical protein
MAEDETDIPLPLQITNPMWSMSVDAIENTMTYIFDIIRHPCYLVGVKNHRIWWYKLQPGGGTAPEIIPALKNELARLETKKGATGLTDTQIADIRKNIRVDETRVMQCIVKSFAEKPETPNEYFLFLKQFARTLDDGLYIFNLTDAVILRADGNLPFVNVYGLVPIPLPPEKRHPMLPILGAGQVGYLDIPIPNYDEVMRVLSGNAAAALRSGYTTNWDKKEARAVFRGGPSGCGTTAETNMRLALALKKNPLVDACVVGRGDRVIKFDPKHGLSKMNAVEVARAQCAKPMSMDDQSRFKYIIHIDGNVNAYRLLGTMLTGSLILRVKSPYIHWADHILRPGVHYLEISRDLSNLDALLTWCIKHDSKCRAIARNGQNAAYVLTDKGVLEDVFTEYLNTLDLLVPDTPRATSYRSTRPLSSVTSAATAATASSSLVNPPPSNASYHSTRPLEEAAIPAPMSSSSSIKHHSNEIFEKPTHSSIINTTRPMTELFEPPTSSTISSLSSSKSISALADLTPSFSVPSAKTPGTPFGSPLTTPPFSVPSAKTPGTPFGSPPTTPPFSVPSAKTPGTPFGSPPTTPPFSVPSAKTPGTPFGSPLATPPFSVPSAKTPGTPFGSPPAKTPGTPLSMNSMNVLPPQTMQQRVSDNVPQLPQTIQQRMSNNTPQLPQTMQQKMSDGVKLTPPASLSTNLRSPSSLAAPASLSTNLRSPSSLTGPASLSTNLRSPSSLTAPVSLSTNLRSPSSLTQMPSTMVLEPDFPTEYARPTPFTPPSRFSDTSAQQYMPSPYKSPTPIQQQYMPSPYKSPMPIQQQYLPSPYKSPTLIQQQYLPSPYVSPPPIQIQSPIYKEVVTQAASSPVLAQTPTPTPIALEEPILSPNPNPMMQQSPSPRIIFPEEIYQIQPQLYPLLPSPPSQQSSLTPPMPPTPSPLLKQSPMPAPVQAPSQQAPSQQAPSQQAPSQQSPVFENREGLIPMPANNRCPAGYRRIQMQDGTWMCKPKPFDTMKVIQPIINEVVPNVDIKEPMLPAPFFPIPPPQPPQEVELAADVGQPSTINRLVKRIAAAVINESRPDIIAHPGGKKRCPNGYGSVIIESRKYCKKRVRQPLGGSSTRRRYRGGSVQMPLYVTLNLTTVRDKATAIDIAKGILGLV